MIHVDWSWLGLFSLRRSVWPHSTYGPKLSGSMQNCPLNIIGIREKKISSRKVTFGHFFKKIFFEFSAQDWGQTVSFEPLVIVNILRKVFSSQKVTLGHFFRIFFFEFRGQNGYQKTSFWTNITMNTFLKSNRTLSESNLTAKTSHLFSN